VLDRWDVLCVGSLLILWFLLLILNYDSLPLQLWDESRNANNALEIARYGHWLVPTYKGVSDHWNTKPPLLIWQMAALMRLGLPPLLAIRLPTMLAALATVGAVWGVCRYALRDRIAAAAAGFLLLSSLYYADIHIARTGDYDVPLSLFVLCSALAFWASIARNSMIRLGWFAVSMAGLVLGVLTKGVAAALVVPGIVAFSWISGHFITLMGNSRAWAVAAAALALCIGYYGSREIYDPGYLQAVWQDELSSVFETFDGGAQFLPFYLTVLARKFEPSMVLVPLALLTLFGRDARRRSIVVLCLSCGGAIAVVLTIAQTKIYWYATPIVPFLAIVAGIGVGDASHFVRAHEAWLFGILRGKRLQGALGLLLALASSATFYRNQVLALERIHHPSSGQLWYGALFQRLQQWGAISQVTVLDSGVETAQQHGPKEEAYNPMLQFYAEIARMNGLFVTIAQVGAPMPASALVVTCDPRVYSDNQSQFVIWSRWAYCALGVSNKER
jgi:4-amino-4-deoxy-L-arabinose transferase-like glycosyltransferase